jgi:HSP20 family protein
MHEASGIAGLAATKATGDGRPVFAVRNLSRARGQILVGTSRHAASRRQELPRGADASNTEPAACCVRRHIKGQAMANNERSRQQSGEAPLTGAMSNQQGGARSASPRGQATAWQDEQRETQGMQRGRDMRQGYGGGRNMPAARGAYEPSLFGGAGGGPFALMRRISDEMDRMFESFGMGGPLSRDFGQGGMLGGGSDLRTLWSPHIEVCERGGKLLIQADLPGIRKEDVNVQVEQDAVILQGERKHETERDERGYYHSERSYGSFYRVIPLPEGVDTEQAKASFRDGVLEIELPAPQQRERGRRLTIEDRSSEGSAGTSSGQTQPGTAQQTTRGPST